MEVQGKIKLLGETEHIGNKGFSKRDVVVTTEDQYPQHISIQFTQDKCDLLDHYKVGSNVKISINLRGREWTSPKGEVKHFNSIEGWRIESLDTAISSSTPPVAQPSEAFEPTTTTTTTEEEDNLPF